MNLYLLISTHSSHGCETDGKSAAGARTEAFERRVPWVFAPNEKEAIYVGRDEKGERDSIVAIVTQREFTTDGITICGAIEFCRDEYDDILSSVMRDGFVAIKPAIVETK